MSSFKKNFFFILVLCLCSLLPGLKAEAASIFMSPPSETFVTGGTFVSSILVDTEGASINAIDITIRFPQDKLQVVSVPIGPSIISLWVNQPSFDNREGTVTLRGVIPGGIKTDSGTIINLQFRAKAVGVATVRFADTSRILLHDGQGTDALQNTRSGIYTLVLPPPGGPLVASKTHADQNLWYQSKNPSLAWSMPDKGEADAYSYVLSDRPVDIPDDIPDSSRKSVTYENISDGNTYFHIKALRGGQWGGVTHFALNIDSSPPAEFPLDFISGKRTSNRHPVVQFATTDKIPGSGIDHYEIKISPLAAGSLVGGKTVDEPLFIESRSPYIFPDLDIGRYDVHVRVYDHAGNYLDVVERLSIVSPSFRFMNEGGLQLLDIIIPWWIIFLLLFIIILLLIILARHVHRDHAKARFLHENKELPGDVASKLDELKKYQTRYGRLSVFLFITAALLFGGGNVRAQEEQLLISPPIITNISKNISNDEIFYVGGEGRLGTQVILYIQDTRTGSIISKEIETGARGGWFYRHDGFLSPGEYILWVQGKEGDTFSPPSPERTLSVENAAIEFGASRLSYEAIYFALVLILLFLITVLVIFIIVRRSHAKKRRIAWMVEVKEAEESVRRGFAVLRRDIQAEMKAMEASRAGRPATEEERNRDEKLVADMAWVEKHIGREIWDVERVGAE